MFVYVIWNVVQAGTRGNGNERAEKVRGIVGVQKKCAAEFKRLSVFARTDRRTLQASGNDCSQRDRLKTILF